MSIFKYAGKCQRNSGTSWVYMYVYRASFNQTPSLCKSHWHERRIIPLLRIFMRLILRLLLYLHVCALGTARRCTRINEIFRHYDEIFQIFTTCNSEKFWGPNFIWVASKVLIFNELGFNSNYLLNCQVESKNTLISVFLSPRKKILCIDKNHFWSQFLRV